MLLDTPQLAQFAVDPGRTPKLKALYEAHIFFDGSGVFVSLPWTRRRGLHFRITPMLSDQLSLIGAALYLVLSSDLYSHDETPLHPR
jgi:hypothetical protein